MSEQSKTKKAKKSGNGAFPHKPMTDEQRQVVADALDAGIGGEVEMESSITASVTVWGAMGKGWDKKTYGSKTALDAHIKEILAEGYQFNETGRTIVYPAHSIKQIDIVVE